MAMELKGKVVQLLEPQTGMGKKGQWKKQEFILETQAQYPKKICLSAWGDKIEQFNLAVGEDINVSVDLESREYNGRWYTEARAWKIDKTGSSSTSGGNGNAAPLPTEEPFMSGGDATDDLPF
jgi:hypothetical protein